MSQAEGYEESTGGDPALERLRQWREEKECEVEETFRTTLRWILSTASEEQIARVGHAALLRAKALQEIASCHDRAAAGALALSQVEGDLPMSYEVWSRYMERRNGSPVRDR